MKHIPNAQASIRMAMPSFPWLLRPGSKTPYSTPMCFAHTCCMPLAPWSDFKSEMTASMSGTFFWGGKCLEHANYQARSPVSA